MNYKDTKKMCNNSTNSHIISRFAFPCVLSPMFIGTIESGDNSLAYCILYRHKQHFTQQFH